MIKGILCAVSVIAMMAFSSAQAVEHDAAFVARIKALAELGDATAQYELASCYNAGDCDGVRQDNVNAFEWYEKAATQGNADAQFNLGVAYEYGQGGQQDYVRACEWYEKAATQGNADAQFKLGVLYESGHGVKQNYAKAREWYKKAAAQGVAQAQYLLGRMYLNGQGVRQNTSTAKKWYGQACDNGLQQGCDNYRKLSEAGF
jgi:TPR repeat protein